MADIPTSTALDHFNSFSSFFSSSNAGGNNSASANSGQTTARVKLQRLTKQQYLELSTDVYDELHRREQGAETPFLLSVASFHMKRNQARQKLATLSATRFTDLASDVFWELKRRYPEFLDQQTGSGEGSSKQTGGPSSSSQGAGNGGTSGSGATGLGINTGETMLPLSNSGGNFAYNVKKELSNQERSSGYNSNYSNNAGNAPATGNLSNSGSNNNLGSSSNNVNNNISSKYVSNASSVPSPLNLLSSPRITNVDTLRRGSPPLQSMSPPPSALRSPDDQKAKISALHRTIRDLQSDLSEKDRESEQRISKMERRERDRQKEIELLTAQLEDARSALTKARSEPKATPQAAPIARPEEVQHLQQLIASLSTDSAEMERLRDRILELERRLTSTTTNSSGITIHKPSFTLKSNGLISDSLLFHLHRSIDSLLSNCRSNLGSVLSSASDCLIGVNALNTALPPSNLILNSISLSVADQESYSVHLHNLNPAAQNLVAAARTHSQSKGYSAISLVDAAASHVNDAVVGLAILVGVKKSDFDPSTVKAVLPLAVPSSTSASPLTKQIYQQYQPQLPNASSPSRVAQQSSPPTIVQPSPASSGTGLMDRFRNIAGVAGALGASAARAATNQTQQSPPTAMISSPPSSIASNLAALVGRGTPSPAPAASMPSSTSASTITALSTPALKMAKSSPKTSQDSKFLYDDVRESARAPSRNRSISHSRSRSRSPTGSLSRSRSRSPSARARSRSSFSRSENSEYRRRSLDEWSQGPSPLDDDGETGMTSEGPYNDRAFIDEDEDPTLARERWEDMQSYLDTDVIDSATSSLNALMSNIRNVASSPSLIQHLSPLLAAGQDLVSRIPTSLPGALRSTGERILSELDADCRTLERIRTRLQREKSDVVLQSERKTLVDAGMGVAKAIRELMGLNLEENDLR